MENLMKNPWFGARKYGWGWGFPITWQGWLVLIGYLGFIVYDFIRLNNTQHSVSDLLINFVPDIIVATIVLVGIAYFTSGKPRWHWGDRDH